MLRLAAVLRPLRDAGTVRRISTTLAVPQRLAGTPLPWFIDPADVAPKRPSARTQPRHALPLAPLPSVIPQESPIGRLHATLATSPHLEPGTLVVREPISSASGPPTQQPAKGRRRRRGGGDPGEGIPDPGSGIWNWIVVAQVKEGTENRGAIESVMRVVRKTLLTGEPPVQLPRKHKRQIGDGWSMLDVGDFAVHVVSRRAREKYFPDVRKWHTDICM